MPQIIVHLTEDQDIKVQLYKIKRKMKTKSEAIAEIVGNMTDQ